MPDDLPSQEQMQQGAEVVAAGEQAAAAETDPKRKRAAARGAIRKEAQSKGWELSEEDADMLAGMVAVKLGEQLAAVPGQTADEIGKRGGYDRLPEPITPPAAPTGAGTLPEQPAPEQDARPGGGRTQGAGAFARWFRSS